MIEIRLNDDEFKTLDEIVGEGKFHFEQMDDDEWFLQLGGCRMFLTVQTYIDGALLIATPIESNDWPSEKERVLEERD